MTEPLGTLVPIMSIAWRGHRVEIHGDAGLSPRNLRQPRQMEATGAIASAIEGARSLEDIGPALRTTAIGRTHDVDVRLEDGKISVWLRPLEVQP